MTRGHLLLLCDYETAISGGSPAKEATDNTNEIT